MVKLSTNIKQQFAKRKGILATFFDVQKAYDQVWHFRLFQKLNKIGLSGNIFFFIRNLLSNRQVIAKVGNSFSTSRYLTMGLPQGSILSPILFNILTHDLTDIATSDVTIVQYADDICMWKIVNLKRSTNKRNINFIREQFQRNLDALENYMTTNGLTISTEKTNLILFNAGENAPNLPYFTLYNQILEYKQSIKFLGLTFTSKLSWSTHINIILEKARKNLNLIKILTKLPWGMDPQTLVHITTAIIRSSITYGQEIYFSAPKSSLKKLQSIESKAYKLAIGVPVHTSTNLLYQTIGILPLEEYRKLSSSKFLIKMNSQESYIENEIKIRSDQDFPKRAQNIRSHQTIATYTKEIFENNPHNIQLENIQNKKESFPIPFDVLPCPKFDTHYTSLKKSENINIISTTSRLHIIDNYDSHLQIFTDGSLLENNDCGAAFVIPQYNIEKSFYLGKYLSIFTAELTAIIMALNFILNFQTNFTNITLFVDSLSVLQSLENVNTKTRQELVYEIYSLLYQLFHLQKVISFCWIPSHCNISGNEKADKAAKRGALQKMPFTTIPIQLSSDEFKNILIKKVSSSFFTNIHLKDFLKKYLNFCQFQLKNKTIKYYRKITSISFKLKLNSIKTKYTKSILCKCGQMLSIEHALLICPIIKTFLTENIQKAVTDCQNITEILSDPHILLQFSEILAHSSLQNLI